jgi:hypothetical protein
MLQNRGFKVIAILKPIPEFPSRSGIAARASVYSEEVQKSENAIMFCAVWMLCTVLEEAFVHLCADPCRIAAYRSNGDKIDVVV